MLRILICVFFSIITMPVAMAHHTWAVDYVTDVEFAEIEGIVSSIAWVNPHVRFEVLVDSESGAEEVWHVAATSVSNLARMDINKNILSIGDTVRMAGFPARRSDTGMYMVNILLPDGREAVFQSNAELRWSSEKIGSSDRIRGDVAEAEMSERPDSIFAVWTTLTGVPESRLLHSRSTEDYPLSEAGLAAIAAYNPETDDPFGSCEPKGGSIVMDAPYPMQLVNQGDTIQLKLEEYDLVRTIHLTDVHDDRNFERDLLGYSTGRWQGDTLLITTTKFDYPFLNVGSVPDYVPQSQHAHYQETFRLGSDHDRLYYTLTVTDTEMLTEPMVMSKYYLWRSGETVQPYLCDEEGLFVTD